MKTKIDLVKWRQASSYKKIVTKTASSAVKVLVIKIVLACVVQTVLDNDHWPAPSIKGTVSRDVCPLFILLKRRYTVFASAQINRLKHFCEFLVFANIFYYKARNLVV